MVPAQCYERTVRLNVPGGHGSGFIISRQQEQWLVTARHVIDGVDASDIEIVWRGMPVAVGLAPVPEAHPGADVAVFALAAPVVPDGLTLIATSDGAVFSQDAYFLGYPYGLGLGAGATTLPFVKKAIISAMNRNVNGVSLWMLDGINNQGFSGGPVVFENHESHDWHVIAVVSGYRTEHIAVDGGAGTVPINTGIIVAYDIRHATESVDAYVP